MNTLIINHFCMECNTESSIVFNTQTGRVIQCPVCGTVNDIWFENESPPEKHINDTNVLEW